MSENVSCDVSARSTQSNRNECGSKANSEKLTWKKNKDFKILQLDAHRTNKKKMHIMQKHRCIVLEALVQMRLSLLRNVHRLHQIKNVPASRIRKCQTQFKCMLKEVDSFMTQLNSMNVVYTSSCYIFYNLEERYAKLLEDYNEIINTNNVEEKGFFSICLDKFLEYFCVSPPFD